MKNSHFSKCLTKEELNCYLSGKVSAIQNRKIELHLSECPLCSDAVEGLSHSQLPELKAPRQKKWKPTPVRLMPYGLAASLVLGVVWAAFELSQVQLPVSGNDYGSADLALMQKAIEENNGSINFALKLLQIGQYDGALSEFVEVKKVQPGLSLYYSAICKLKLGDKNSARSLLLELLQCCDFKAQETKLLLKQLNKADNS